MSPFDFTLSGEEWSILDRFFTALHKGRRISEISEETRQALQKLLFVPATYTYQPDFVVFTAPVYDIAIGNSQVSSHINTLQITFNRVFSYRAKSTARSLFNRMDVDVVRLLCILLLVVMNRDQHKGRLLEALNTGTWRTEALTIYRLFSSLH